MANRTTRHLIVALAAMSFGIACDSGKKETTTNAVEQALSARVPAAAPTPPPAPPAAVASAEPKKIEVPPWVDQYAAALCKRVAVCREKMLTALPPQQKAMLAMQIPSQEACLKNTRTFKEKAPKPELDQRNAPGCGCFVAQKPTCPWQHRASLAKRDAKAA